MNKRGFSAAPFTRKPVISFAADGNGKTVSSNLGGIQSGPTVSLVNKPLVSSADGREASSIPTSIHSAPEVVPVSFRLQSPPPNQPLAQVPASPALHSTASEHWHYYVPPASPKPSNRVESTQMPAQQMQGNFQEQEKVRQQRDQQNRIHQLNEMSNLSRGQRPNLPHSKLPPPVAPLPPPPLQPAPPKFLPFSELHSSGHSASPPTPTSPSSAFKYGGYSRFKQGHTPLPSQPQFPAQSLPSQASPLANGDGDGDYVRSYYESEGSRPSSSAPSLSRTQSPAQTQYSTRSEPTSRHFATNSTASSDVGGVPGAKRALPAHLKSTQPLSLRNISIRTGPSLPPPTTPLPASPLESMLPYAAPSPVGTPTTRSPPPSAHSARGFQNSPVQASPLGPRSSRDHSQSGSQVHEEYAYAREQRESSLSSVSAQYLDLILNLDFALEEGEGEGRRHAGVSRNMSTKRQDNGGWAAMLQVDEEEEESDSEATTIVASSSSNAGYTGRIVSGYSKSGY